MNADVVLTESSVCKMHIEHGTSVPVYHPATVFWDAYQGTASGDARNQQIPGTA